MRLPVKPLKTPRGQGMSKKLIEAHNDPNPMALYEYAEALEQNKIATQLRIVANDGGKR